MLGAKDQTNWDLLAKNTPQDFILQQDVGWTTYAGKDPIDFVNKYPGRTVTTHYKAKFVKGTSGTSIIGQDKTDWAGLTKAVRKFDPRERPALLTYAVPTIRGEIQRYFRDHGWTVRPPRSVQELQWRASRGIETLSQALGRDPSPDELCGHLECTREELDRALADSGAFSPTSLDHPADGDGSFTLADTLAVTDDRATAPTVLVSSCSTR